VSFSPPPEVFPSTFVSPSAQVTVRFSEAVDPSSIEAMDGFLLLRGDSRGGAALAEDVVVGVVAGASDLRSFTFHPSLPFAHQPGTAERLQVRLGEVTDLAGARLRRALPPIDFTLAADAPGERNASIALRFSELDELAPRGSGVLAGSLLDLRGQVVHDLDRGRIRPREVRFASSARWGAGASRCGATPTSA
jgi:hypothetical protein